MPTQLRPNLMTTAVDSPTAPPGLQFYAYVEQPVPASDQSATVIRAWGYVTSSVDVSAGTTVFTCWDAAPVGDDLAAGIRQIGDAITLGTPAVAVDADAVVTPFFLQWIDTAAPQSGIYMIAFDPADQQSAVLGEDSQTVIYPIAP